jgi:hypothetical protein
LKGEKMEDDTFKRIRLEELVTRREGMIAENKFREYLGQSPAYVEDSFAILADEMRQLAER